MKYIFIHGLGQRSSSWNQTISFLSTSVTPDCPDLFTLLKTKECTYSNLYQVFSDYCESIVEPLNLCGLSLGGILALHYAIDHPERINSLVLIGVQYKMPKQLLKMQNLIFQLMPQFVFKTMGMDKQTFIQLTNSMQDLDFSHKLKELSCTTLILCGEKDRVNKKAAENLVENIAQAKFSLIARAGHEVNQVAPESLATILDRFYLLE